MGAAADLLYILKQFGRSNRFDNTHALESAPLIVDRLAGDDILFDERGATIPGDGDAVAVVHVGLSDSIVETNTFRRRS